MWLTAVHLPVAFPVRAVVLVLVSVVLAHTFNKGRSFGAVGTILYVKALGCNDLVILKHNEVMHVCSFSAQKVW